MRTCLFSLATIALAALFTSSAALAHGVTMKLRHPLAADSAFHTRFVLPWTEKVHQDSGGRISFQVQAGDPMPEKLLDLVQEATADVVWTAPAWTPRRLSALEVFQLPTLTKDAGSASQSMWEYVRLSDAAQNELDGMRLLAVHQVGTPVFHMRARPIAKSDDLKGLKIAACTPYARAFLAHAGATPIDLSLVKVADALAADAIDGALLPWDLTPAQGNEAKAYSEPGAVRLDAPVFVLLMNAGTYRGLPDDLKKVIQDNSGPETGAWLVKAFEQGGHVARESAGKRGAAINTIPVDEAAKWQPAAQAAIQDWIEATETQGGKEALEAAREALGD